MPMTDNPPIMMLPYSSWSVHRVVQARHKRLQTMHVGMADKVDLLMSKRALLVQMHV